MTTYLGFKDHLAAFLWREGDAVLLNALDAMIAMAETELQRVLKVQDNHGAAILDFTGGPLTLPDDYRTLDQLVDADGDYDYLPPGLFAERQSHDRLFTIVGHDLLLSGYASPEAPHAVTLTYYRKLPKFRDTDASWLAETHLDLFTYCVLRHAGRFVRDDDRVADWDVAYKTALGDVIEEDVGQRYALGGPRRIVLRRQVG